METEICEIIPFPAQRFQPFAEALAEEIVLGVRHRRELKIASEIAWKMYHNAQKKLAKLRKGYGKRPSFTYSGPKYAGLSIKGAHAVIVEHAPDNLGPDELALLAALHRFKERRNEYYAQQERDRRACDIERLHAEALARGLPYEYD